MKRGRVLQALSKGNIDSRGDQHQRHEDQISQQTREDEPQVRTVPPTTTGRGRGGLIGRQVAARAGLTTESRTTENISPDPDPPAPRSRQGSGSSRASILSQQFAAVDLSSRGPRPVISKEPSEIGREVRLSLNYFSLTESSLSVEEYHVDFKPNIESIRLRVQMLRSEQGRAVIGEVMHWTGTNLYLPKRLPNRKTEFSTTHPGTGSTVHISVIYVKTPPDDELLPFYNSLIHRVMTRLRYVIFNRHHYSPIHKIAIQQHNLEVWPGWITAIQRFDGGLKLVIDSSFKVVRLETVRDLLKMIRSQSVGSSLKEAFEAELVGSIVMTTYNNRPYRIDGIDITKKPSDSFTMDRHNGREITYIDYMREHWNVTINDPNQPMIVHHPRPRGGVQQETVYLIPELCVATGLTDEMRSNFTLMKSIGEHTRLPPDMRESKLIEFLNQLSTDERATSILENWNLKIKPSLDVVTGRKLDCETVMFQNNQVKVPDNVDWSRAATSSQAFKGAAIKNWVIVYPERENAIAQDFLAQIKDISRVINIQFNAPRIVKISNDATTTYVNTIRREVTQSDDMVVILTPGKSQREDRYSACKRLLSCDKAVPCQFIRCGTIANPRKIRSICQKIAIQVLSKVGGQPWAMSFPMKSFMVVGIDAFHDTIDRKRSCVGFVASMNEHTSSWWSHTFFQDSLEEIGQKVSSCMTAALRRFHDLNKFIPAKIIVYRDGVGDGQLEAVIRCEVAQAINAVQFYMRDEHSEVPQPSISYLIVQKRINTKFSLRSGNQLLNPSPGTFIDHTITHPNYNDFYLVSQHVTQGTVSPTKYILLHESGSLKIQHHQRLAYKMTHMYFNWCGTIRVPAPCQYAHKLAYLVGENIRQQVSESLEDKLYYL